MKGVRIGVTTPSILLRMPVASLPSDFYYWLIFSLRTFSNIGESLFGNFDTNKDLNLVAMRRLANFAITFTGNGAFFFCIIKIDWSWPVCEWFYGSRQFNTNIKSSLYKSKLISNWPTCIYRSIFSPIEQTKRQIKSRADSIGSQ